ncbi:MAG TPA: DUF934 domain-containing protein [Methylophilaceae bacterium]|nr:DUF934 domain-containing protein [Methylophilaceae bacterium]
MSNLIRNGAIVPDEWTVVNLPVVEEAVRKQAGKVVLFKLTGESSATPEQIAGTQIPPTGKVIVPVTVWIARKAELADRAAKDEVGVWLAPHETVETLTDAEVNLNQFPIIGIYHERHGDGRPYSMAVLLRTRYGYTNELRVFGDVLRDQLFFYKRCGFDSFLVRADRSAEDALASLKDFSVPYQGAVDEKLPVWRRVNRG